MLVHASEQSSPFFLKVAWLGRFDLNRRVIYFVLLLEKLGHCIKCVTGITLDDNMSCENWFLIRKSPQMEVVDLFDHVQLLDRVVDLDRANTFGGSLHQKSHAIFEDRHSGNHDKDRKEESANWVSDGPIGLNVDDYCSDDDTQTLDHVSHHMYDGCTHV